MKTGIKNAIYTFVIVLSSCIPKNAPEYEQIIDQKIVIPEFSSNDFLCTNDTLDFAFFNKELNKFPYKIVVYADSLNCIDCDLNLIEWKQRIKEIEKRHLDVCFLFLINPNYFSVVKQTIQRDMFYYPIFFDKQGLFAKANDFPKNIKHVTFLLDEKDQIVLIGNPINNSNSWDLYINKITSK